MGGITVDSWRFSPDLTSYTDYQDKLELMKFKRVLKLQIYGPKQ